MQPTLYGITPSSSKPPGVFDPDLQVPSLPVRIFDSLVRGVSYYRVIARADGDFVRFEEPKTVFPFVKRQRLLVGDETLHDLVSAGRVRQTRGNSRSDPFERET